jgi:regulator of sirC expression with transglutaminase-like and TPR domain
MGTHNEQIVALFADLVSRDDASINVPAAALAMARVHYPELELEPYLERLAAMGRSGARAIDGTYGEEGVARLSRFVFEELGFRGNREEYYDPRNSFLNEVLERRLGIPITLSLVYIELGRAGGLEMEGVGFPGHFLVLETISGTLLDPFNGGVELDAGGLEQLLVAQGLDDTSVREEFIEPVTKRQMLLRMLNNLRRHYSGEGDAVRLARLEAMAEALYACEADGPPLIQ